MSRYKFYTDGGYRPSVADNVAGWGVVVVDPTGKIIGTESGCVMNPEMRQIDGELKAATVALEVMRELGLEKAEIVHDYLGVGKWPTGQWKTNKKATRDYALHMKSSEVDITYSWVKGHDGNEFNEEADNLATDAIYSYAATQKF